ncbi:cobalamin B12-binding domain-containing protein [Vallitalea guaymasensis]|uniref:Corrinoid protein n=1 Tax=Vallitalea guaymasensis TaxID=1185412 RepID=A0A8J8SBH9_9FIRM|nr:corrinoid protein [Vallitalea guaymasensis]QUH28346.1 corrinoid protein [Vallitalea guaymasensis]
MDNTLNEISKYVQEGQSIKVRKLTISALEKGYDYKQILNTLIDAMDIIGKKFKKNEVYVPEVLIASRAFNIALDIISPLIDPNVTNYLGKVVIGTVQGDLHDIGKNLVKMMLVGMGFQVIDLGVDISPQEFVDAVKKHDPDIIAMSALLTTTMITMKNTIKLLEEEGLRDNLTVFIGGAPITSNYARTIGADVYSTDAASAAEVAKEIVRNNI